MFYTIYIRVSVRQSGARCYALLAGSAKEQRGDVALVVIPRVWLKRQAVSEVLASSRVRDSDDRVFPCPQLPSIFIRFNAQRSKKRSDQNLFFNLKISPNYVPQIIILTIL